MDEEDQRDHRPPLRHRPALRRPDDRHAQRAPRGLGDAARLGHGAGRPAGDRGPEGPARWRTSCTRCRSARGQRQTVFRNDLIRSSVLEVGANFFSKDPWALNIGPGSVRLSYRPIAFEGTFTAVPVNVAHDVRRRLHDAGRQDRGRSRRPCAATPGTEGCVRAPGRAAGHRGARRPDRHLGAVRAHGQGTPYELADAARWVDPASGEVQVRFVNQRAGAGRASSSRSRSRGPIR